MQELEVGYIDLNGTFALICDGVYVDVVRPANGVQESSRRQEHLFQPVPSNHSRAVSKSYKPYRLEELASEAQLSQPVRYSR